eukprot:5965357-Lingulodinium_polyedra.AAC.1
MELLFRLRLGRMVVRRLELGGAWRRLRGAAGARRAGLVPLPCLTARRRRLLCGMVPLRLVPDADCGTIIAMRAFGCRRSRSRSNPSNT